MQQQEQCVETTVEIGDGLSVAQKQKKSGNDANSAGRLLQVRGLVMAKARSPVVARCVAGSKIFCDLVNKHNLEQSSCGSVVEAMQSHLDCYLDDARLIFYRKL